MNILKQKAVSFLISTIILSIITIVYTSLLYTGKINNDSKAIYRTTFIIGTIVFFLFGLISGMIEKKHGFLSNFISGLIVISIIILIRLLSKRVILLNDWIKYAVYLISCMLGGILGVNMTFKRKKGKSK